MKQLFYIISVIALAIVSLSVIAHAVEQITVCGTGDNQSLMRNLAAAFEKANPGASVIVPDSIGSGGGIRATAKGKCELARVARGIKEKEKKFGLNYMKFAISAVVFVVHPSVEGVNNLTAEQISGIYSGRYDSWDQLGGPVHKIYPVGREDGDSSRAVLNKRLKGFKDVNAPVSKTAFTSPENVELLVKNEFTIGYGSMSMFKGREVKTISVDGVGPTVKNITDEAYDITVDYGIVFKGEPGGLTGKFMEYLYTADAAKVILENGSFPAR